MPRKAKLLLLLVFAVHALGLWLWTLGKAQRQVDPVPAPADAAAGAEPGWRPAHKADRWTCIVIHHSASAVGDAAQFDRQHRKQGWDELGYHFVIGNGTGASRDGQVEVGPRWGSQKHGAHCKTPGGYYNEHGIGICLVGNFDNGPPGERQMRSLDRLVRFLCREFDIGPSQILTHGGVTGETACPGKHFDVEVVRRAVEAEIAKAE